MDEKTPSAENPFRPLICHRTIRKNIDGRPQEVVCGDIAEHFEVTATRMHNATIMLGHVDVWLCKKHATAARKAGFTLR